ncbi:MAG TPA: glycosyltransferase [Candidatus Acidoferrales bacterium]|nr:glycosyltransferase [Candidatus Acidoferrales bacterium]
MPEASVVIATHDRSEELRACLESLELQSARARFEIVVVDNGSRDATQSVIAAAPHVVPVFVAEPNRAKARNAGIAAASGELILFCDDDTIAPRDFVSAHLAAHRRTSRALVSGPIINVQDAASSPAPRSRNYSRAFFCTCNASVAKQELLAVGGFDEQYDLYGWEDTDLGIRLRERGLRRVFDWSAFIYHVKPPATMAFERRRAQAQEKGTMAARFVRKNPSLAVRLATGAYTLNFARAAVLRAPPVRALCERLARAGPQSSLTSALATDALVDGIYVDALRAGLRQARA